MHDVQGNALSGGTQEAVALLDKAVHAFTIGHGDPLSLLDEAAKSAPDMPIPLIAKAWILAMPVDPKLAVTARALAEQARALPMNARERGLFAALEMTLAGERRASATALDTHLLDHPRDVLAHFIGAYVEVLLGRGHQIRERAARAAPFWSPDVPGFAVFRTVRAFGMEESGDYEAAEEEAQAAIATEPHLYFAHHTVAHCMEMTGRPAAGVAWSKERESFWASAASFGQSHLWWHTSLFHVELGQFDAALALCDGPLLRTVRPMGFAICDPTALLWRLDTLGHDVGNRWEELLPRWEEHADGRGIVFTDMHAAMAELRSGNEAQAEARLAKMRQTAAGNDEAASMYRDVGVPLVEGVIAFHRAAYDDCLAHLFPLRDEVRRIGGSNAQRDIVDWTLTVAALRAGRKAMGLGLAYERLAGRPESLINRRFEHTAEQLAA